MAHTEQALKLTNLYTMKHLTLLLLCFGLYSCAFGQKSSEDPLKEYPGIEEETFYKLYEDAIEKTPNFRIVYGFHVGVSEPEFDRILAEKIKKGEIIAIDTSGYSTIIQFDILNKESIPMEINCSASGVFKNFPLISFRTQEFEDSLELIKTRNKFLDWAIAKYGDQYHVSPMEDFLEGTMCKNFRWVTNTYSIDITDMRNQVALTYRTLR